MRSNRSKPVPGVRALALALALAAFGCGDDDDPADAGACVPGTGDGCAEGEICEETTYGEPACFLPVVIAGRVFDLGTDAGIGGALVVARDENGAALGRVAVTAADGTYRLPVPVQRTDESGAFLGAVLTLRVDAAGYESYPGGFRPSLPVDLDDNTVGETEIVVQTPTTDVALIPLEGGSAGLGAIRGTVPDGAGALVVAEAGGAGLTGVADADGAYAVLNVPAGSYNLRAYAAGKQYAPITAAVEAGATVDGADFAAPAGATATVSGNVNIVNAPGGSVTSVVLVVEETFSDTFVRGEVPPGLRAGDVTGAFTISGVPDGRYVVLAAFENDGLVRDPDTSIAGTQIVHIDVAGADLPVPDSFKVTEALAVTSPGAEAPEAVTGTPTFVFADDSSEDMYAVVVFNSYGELVWEKNDVPSVSGGGVVSVPYEGPALEAGLYYQWRATSLKDGVPKSTTEDLRGLFYTGSAAK